MEKDHCLLLAELARVRKLVGQMEAELPRHSANESCKGLLRELFASIEKSIYMAKTSRPNSSRPSSGESSQSDPSKLGFKDETSKKRKTLPKWTSEVRVSSAAGGVFEGPVDDGYSWRKYGQKDILGSKHPRGYYRCTHRIAQGCPATKQVQRSDEDPLLFHVTFRGTHTCLRKQGQRQQRPKEDESQRGLRVEASSLSFSFESGLEAAAARENMFASPATTENCFSSSTSPTFQAPAASDSTFFSLSRCGIEAGIKLWSPESDVTEMVSRANSTVNPPAVDMDFMLQELDFEADFSSFFS
ncbi:hypothetical protein BHE74_00049734 [Ensete ventricosum]|nr:hypothetical protein GW17_00029976 [Ensete ventricosum]RWW44498.1 hypothetical protein BHE74_00049734 [Ensete ventricosum]